MKKTVLKYLLVLGTLSLLSLGMSACVVTARGSLPVVSVDVPVISVETDVRVPEYEVQFYPDVNVYFDPRVSVYYWNDGGRWINGPRWPGHIRHTTHFERFRTNGAHPYDAHPRVMERWGGRGPGGPGGPAGPGRPGPGGPGPRGPRY